MLNSLLTKFEKGLEAAATAALPAAAAAESRQLLEGSKSDVEGVIKGSLLRTGASAVSYVPVARATVAKEGVGAGGLCPVGLRRKRQPAEDSKRCQGSVQ